MNLADIYAQIEEEISWRRDEIRFLKNQLSFIQNEDEKNKYRKSLVVMLYSHYEGYCKTIFQIYIKSINNEFLSRKNVNNIIVASSLSEIFKAYSNLDKKNKFFKNVLPDDDKLHLFSRQVEFINMIDSLWDEVVYIPENIVDTESNLKPVVLRKILFRLGFEYDSFLPYEGLIHKLLNKRNAVAHGAEKGGVEEKEYEEVEKVTFTIMDDLKKMVTDALDKRQFLRVAGS